MAFGAGSFAASRLENHHYCRYFQLLTTTESFPEVLRIWPLCVCISEEPVRSELKTARCTRAVAVTEVLEFLNAGMLKIIPVVLQFRCPVFFHFQSSVLNELIFSSTERKTALQMSFADFI